MLKFKSVIHFQDKCITFELTNKNIGIMETFEYLEIGQRYYLDAMENVSGVCLRAGETGIYFGEIIGFCTYLKNGKDEVGFNADGKRRYVKAENL